MPLKKNNKRYWLEKEIINSEKSDGYEMAVLVHKPLLRGFLMFSSAIMLSIVFFQ